MRLFTGIEIPPHVRARVAGVLKDLRPLASVNWTPVENLHITTKFIGDWPEERMEELEAALEGAADVSPFEVKVAQFGYFPNPHRPHGFFAAVHAGPELKQLANKIEAALEPLGVAREHRAFTPHLTLARIKHENIGELRDHIAKMTDFDFGTFRVTGFQLFLSKPGPKGSIYSPLASYQFRQSASTTAGSPE